MAIVSFDQIWDSNRFTRQFDGVINWERYYRAITDSPGLDNEFTVQSDPRCPALGNAVSPTLTGITVREIEVTPRSESRIEFFVRVLYSNAALDGSGGTEGGGGGEEPKADA